MTRLRLALAGAFGVLLALPATGDIAARSTLRQVKASSAPPPPTIGGDETGTVAVGLGGVNPITYIERPPGWNSAGMTITRITGAPASAKGVVHDGSGTTRQTTRSVTLKPPA